jgi:hypothetical protein
MRPCSDWCLICVDIAARSDADADPCAECPDCNSALGAAIDFSNERM